MVATISFSEKGLEKAKKLFHQTMNAQRRI